MTPAETKLRELIAELQDHFQVNSEWIQGKLETDLLPLLQAPESTGPLPLSVEQLFPCICLYGQYQWESEEGKPEPAKFTEHGSDCPASYRPAIQAALAQVEVGAYERAAETVRTQLVFQGDQYGGITTPCEHGDRHCDAILALIPGQSRVYVELREANAVEQEGRDWNAKSGPYEWRRDRLAANKARVAELEKQLGEKR